MKILDLSSDQLDYAIARIEKIPVSLGDDGFGLDLVTADGKPFHPTSDKKFADEIVKRTGMTIRGAEGRDWIAHVHDDQGSVGATDVTRELAIMRCHALSRIGNTITIPDDWTYPRKHVSVKTKTLTSSPP